MINLKTASSKEIASYFSHKVNNFCFNPKAASEELKSSRLMNDLDLCWIRILSDPAYRTDLRNENLHRQAVGLLKFLLLRKS